MGQRLLAAGRACAPSAVLLQGCRQPRRQLPPTSGPAWHLAQPGSSCARACWCRGCHRPRSPCWGAGSCPWSRGSSSTPTCQAPLGGPRPATSGDARAVPCMRSPLGHCLQGWVGPSPAWLPYGALPVRYTLQRARPARACLRWLRAALQRRNKQAVALVKLTCFSSGPPSQQQCKVDSSSGASGEESTNRCGPRQRSTCRRRVSTGLAKPSDKQRL